MKDDTLRVLEFDRILEAISGFSHSEATKKTVLELCPLKERVALDKRFGFIAEIKRFNEKGYSLGFSQFEDISPYLEKIRPEDSILEAGELYSFITVLNMISEIPAQINENDDLPLLRSLVQNITGFPEILKALAKSIDSNGNILDSASSALSGLRMEIRSLEKNIRRKLEEKISDRHVSPFLQDTFITQRAGRWVIPVRMDSKGHIAGVVHDISRSGETAFMEPIEIIGPANELENLIADARAEEIRILKTLCKNIRQAANELSAQYETLLHLDLLNSIVRFSEYLKSEIPEITDSLSIRLADARHPLLEFMRKDGAIKNVIPLDLELGDKNMAMVITGPNAGGKTIAIKTVGLLLLMALSGIPVPAAASSVFPFVSRVFVDIGDEQSIEASLSTFSAHVSNISRILKSESANAVVLLDELGTGTEPAQGSAIACAVLSELKRRDNLVLATTHLMEIVGFVQRADGMVNASMEFDAKKRTPLYRLRLGEPGQSHAIETAMRFGLPGSVIDSAKTFLGKMNIELYELISDLRKKRSKYEEALRDFENKKRTLEEKERTLKERALEIDRKKKEAEENAYRESDIIIRNIKQQMRALLEEAKKKDRTALKKAEKIHKAVIEKINSFREGSRLSIDQIKKGDVVFVRSVNYDATVVDIDKKHERLKVRAKGIEIEVPALDINTRKGDITLPETITFSGIEKRSASSRIDFIGLRVDEAISRLEPFLNDATLAGFDEVIIVHGVGTGALLRAVHDHLKGHPLVKEFRSGELSEGGRGVTIAKLK